MRVRCFIAVFLFLPMVCFLPAHAQMGFELDIKKEDPYQERLLRAEKTPTDKKLKGPGRLFQNMTTHFNYVFNAKNKLNEVIAAAKSMHEDDYSVLLSFYNYDLEMTASNKMQLDSVIYKSRTGIVLHDLRNDWIDNLYLLWGASYFLQKEFDSAAMMFQFINYAFAERDEDGYFQHIGTRVEGQNTLTISTPEKKRMLSASPSRNDALVWLIRSLIEMENMAEAASLLSTLRTDPHFPKRLWPALEEVQSYWFYRQGMWDSSAHHLVLALDQATTKQEKARWEYLAAQMFEKSRNQAEAEKYYHLAIRHTTDPVLDIYARLNLVKNNKEGGGDYIDRNIADLLKMARRDKYAGYRDVIYYMAARMELERGNMEAARALLIRGARYDNNNLAKSRAYLQIAHLSYDQKKYEQAAMFYDSVNVADIDPEDALLVNLRKPVLKMIMEQTGILNRQDSLQKLAFMSPDERDALINRMVRQLRKQQGLKDDGGSPGITAGGGPGQRDEAPNLFGQQQRGEWYFYNPTLKTQGSAQFKQTWGNRPNVDNWRRFSDVSKPAARLPNTANDPMANATTDGARDENIPTYDALVRNIPLTPEAMAASQDSVRQAMFRLGMIFLNELADYPAAIDALESLRQRFPDAPNMDEILFNLFYAYTKNGNADKAAAIKKLLEQHHAGSRYAAIATTGRDPRSDTATTVEATRDYEAIYDMFLEGRFEEARSAKRRADSVYQTNQWAPQLLYIEAVYLVRQREDSLAIQSLQTLVSQDPADPLAVKAATLIDVVRRRHQIEAELDTLNIQRPADTLVARRVVTAPVHTAPPEGSRPVSTNIPDTAVRQPVVTAPAVPTPQENQIKPPVDTSTVASTTQPVDTTTASDPAPQPVVISPPVQAVSPEGFVFSPMAAHYAVVILRNVDVVFGNEARNSFARYHRERVPGKQLSLQILTLNPSFKLLVIDGFENAAQAAEYVMQARKLVAGEILPWLKHDRYSLTILSQQNLEKLQAEPLVEEYSGFMEPFIK